MYRQFWTYHIYIINYMFKLYDYFSVLQVKSRIISILYYLKLINDENREHYC